MQIFNGPVLNCLHFIDSRFLTGDRYLNSVRQNVMKWREKKCLSITKVDMIAELKFFFIDDDAKVWNQLNFIQHCVVIFNVHSDAVIKDDIL